MNRNTVRSNSDFFCPLPLLAKGVVMPEVIAERKVPGLLVTSRKSYMLIVTFWEGIC